jgi:hypothetical protein
LVLAAVLAGVCAIWAAGACTAGWLGPALRDPMTIRHGAVALGSLAALYVLAGMMWRMGRARKRSGPADGTAAIEFVLLFPIALCVALVMMQSMLLVTGNIVVHYAGYAAARAAIVHVPERDVYEEPRNVVADPDYSGKWLRIRLAAVEALKGVSAGARGDWGPVPDDAGDGQAMEEGYDRFYALYDRPTPRWVRTMLANKWDYALAHTEVTLIEPAVGGVYGDHEDLTVTVRHQLYLSVPYAKRLFGRELYGGSGHYAAEATATYTLTNQGVEDQIDVEVFPRYVGRGSS